MNDFELVEKGEIVSTVSPLALDEDIGCKKCGAIFTLAEAQYDEQHELYSAITKHGFRCPKCENINFVYVITPKLRSLEQSIKNAPDDLKTKARRKYQREFWRTQKQFGMKK